MSFRCEHIFTGLIEGKNITQVRLDYSVEGIQERIDKIESVLKEYDNFLMQYFDKHFLSTVSKYDELSLDNNICKRLETFADYILNQVKKEDKIEYKFYSDYRDFEKEIKKELNLETVTDNNNGENIINFLLEKGNNYKKSKEITINDKDFLREDFLGTLLREYKSCKDYLNELKKTGTAKEKYYCNKNITSINSDMLYCKEHIDGIFGTNLRNALSDSECPDFDGIDFSNLHHIECMLKSSKSSMNFDNDYSMQLNYFKSLYHKVYKTLNDKERNICQILSWGNSSLTQVNDALRIGYETNNIKELYQLDTNELKKIIYSICKRIANEHEKDIEKFLKKNYEKGLYKKIAKKKVCTKCKIEQPISNFWKRELSKDGVMNVCKKCYKK